MFKSLALFLSLTALSVSAQAATLPGDAAKGGKLHQANCTSCHTDSVYQRKDRRVTNVEGIASQVSACGHQTSVKLSKENTDDLVKFLNDKYYKFK